MSEIIKDDLASLSVRRPFLILVINLLIALAGIAALSHVEVRELPDVDQPVVSVRGVLPGATPETMDAEVTSIIEGAVARVSGIKNIRSSSEENNFRVHAEFTADTDLMTAASDVREAVNQVQRELPDDVEQISVVKAQDDARPIINIAVTSQHLKEEELTRIIEKDIVPEIIGINGVADVPLFGARQKVLHVVINPLRLASYGLTVNDLANVLYDAPLDVPTGSFKAQDQELLVRANATTVTEEQVKNIIIKDTTRIGDVAQVYFGPEDVDSLVYLNKRPVIGLGVIRQAHSNTIEISEQVNKVVERLNKKYDNIQLTITEDSAIFIESSVAEVLSSLAMTIIIVVASLWLFLGNLRATLIPSTAIPLALIGTLAGIWLMGFSINITTLLAIVLATGLVVDDAIVVLENIQRVSAQGLKPRAAAVLGTRQVIFAVIATTAVLVSVFVPIALIPGSAGKMFREFGFVLACAVIISSFVALSIVPAMAARFPLAKPNKSDHPNLLERLGLALAKVYMNSVHFVLDRAILFFVLALVLAATAGWIYPKLSNELLPSEDRGVLYVDATGPDGVGLNYIGRQAEQIEAIAEPYLEQGLITDMFTTVGRYDPNRAQVMLPFVPWEQRSISQQQVQAELNQQLSLIPGARIRVSSPNSLAIRGNVGGIEVALLGNDYQQIYAATLAMVDAINEQSTHITQPDISYRPTQPQLSLEIDRRRAADLGISLSEIANTLRAVVDGWDLVDLSIADESIPIILETSSTRVSSPQDLANLYVSSASGRQLPLSSVVEMKENSVAAELDRHAQRRAIEISANLTEGYPLADAMAEMQAIAEQVLPDDIHMIFLGEAQTLEETSNEVAFTYAIALLIVFLVLCAQFEGIASAINVMTVVPFGLAAAIYALWLTGTSVNIYSQIGLVMLIGLMAKNGILMVEFADQLRDKGYNIRQAIEQAANVRLRPIALTMVSTVLGGLPLILSSGAGAEARSAIGWVMFGGLGLAALFTLYLTPVVYLATAKFHKPRGHEQQALEAELMSVKEIH
ncbi:efflux RND transporter permease subunit [Catenovulum sp. 2E275]|uniref:efflux RND transporter permease subunit n=1 Tax=Catenovulum sp. 2E275 TaxID=2980497 RepID=UPI0021CE742A|nr:efflux RND transporter permease subunit [Catenovulum sp. 2E275]MCU4677519.1 efflux RND transporter permease subunit [Catenovulum sp. 2E275]